MARAYPHRVAADRWTINPMSAANGAVSFRPGASPVRLGVTGTDTGIGKTIIACALAARAVQLGLRVGVMKPVESGIDDRTRGGEMVRSDAEALRDAAQSRDPMSTIRPYVLAEPLAPMMAAQRAGVLIEPAVLDDAYSAVCADRDCVLVEGAGGLLVPITQHLSYLELFARWQCALVVVAGNRLGVLNHVLLTVRAAENAGVTVRAIVLTSFASPDSTIAEATNYDALVTMLPTHRIFRFPYLDTPDDHSLLATAAAAAGLDAILS